MRNRRVASLLTAAALLFSGAPAAFAADAPPTVLYEMNGDRSAELSLGGLSSNVYSIQLEFSIASGSALAFEPDLMTYVQKLDMKSDDSAILYLDSTVPLNNAKDSTKAILGILSSSTPFQLASTAKLTTLDVSLVPTIYDSVVFSEKKENSDGGGSGGGSGGSGSGSGSSTEPQQTDKTTSVTAGSDGTATVSKSTLLTAKTLTVKSGSATVLLDSDAVEALRKLNADISINTIAMKMADESRVTQAQLSGGSNLYKLSVTSGGNAVALPNGSVRMNVPFSGKGSPMAYLMNEKGLLTRLGTATLADGQASFNVNPTPGSRVVVMDVVHSFSDVKGWYDGYVNTMVDSKVMSGLSAGSFQPDRAMTRAELVTTLANLSGDSKAAAVTKFSDVKAEDWFAPYVAWAQNSGITAGVTPTEFMPQSRITREQMAVMLVKFMEYKKKELTLDQPAVSFSDASQISGYARDAMSLMQRSGIIGGKDNNRVDPQGQATRAECAKMLSMVLLELK